MGHFCSKSDCGSFQDVNPTVGHFKMSIQLLVISRCKSDCGSFRDVNLTVARCTSGGLASNLQTVLATELYNDLNESPCQGDQLAHFCFSK